MNELVRRLRDALEPFARNASHGDGTGELQIPDGHAVLFRGSSNTTPSLLEGDFRRARDAHREAASFIEHTAKEVGAVSDEMVERLRTELAEVGGIHIAMSLVRSALEKAIEASRTPVVAAPVAWHCVGSGDGWAEDKITRDAETAADYAKRPHQWKVTALAPVTPSSPDVELQATKEKWRKLCYQHEQTILDERTAREAAEARASSAVKALEQIVNPSTVAGMHEQDSADKLQGIARTTLKSIRGGEDGR